jgi:hypothetical protein
MRLELARFLAVLIAAPGVPMPAGCAASAPAAAVALPPSPPSTAPPAALQPVSSQRGEALSVSPSFRGCAADKDCIAVDRIGCCRNGWKEAVAASQAAAYAASFHCPDPHPVCPMYLVRDDRVPVCDRVQQLCELRAKP